MMRPPRGCCDFISRMACLRAKKRARQVDRHHRTPLLKREILHRNPRRVDAGVVEENVQAARTRP